MKITENFIDPLNYHGELKQQVSLRLVVNESNEQYIEVDINTASPRIRVEDVGTLIGMLEALRRRAGR